MSSTENDAGDILVPPMEFWAHWHKCHTSSYLGAVHPFASDRFKFILERFMHLHLRVPGFCVPGFCVPWSLCQRFRTSTSILGYVCLFKIFKFGYGCC